MNVTGMPTWLEQLIGSNRDPASIAEQIAQHPEFAKIIQESITFAQSNSGAAPARLIAEHIAFLMHRMIDEFTTMHN